jgi:phosphate transport system substrate-binding protein
MKSPRNWLALSVILASVAATSCSPSTHASSDQTKKLVLKGAGSTFAAPLYKKWAEEYALQHPDIQIDYDVVGSGEGQAKFIDNVVDFGASDSALSDEQISKVAKGVQLVPVAAGSIVLTYNLPGVPDGLKLPRTVYAGIFLGKIKFWNDPKIGEANPGIKLPAEVIVTVNRMDKSGTTYAFTNHLATISSDWRNGPGVGTAVQWVAEHRLGGKGNEGVAGVVQRTAGTIGYVEFGIAKRAGLHMAVLENREGKFIRPTAGSGLATLLSAELPSNLRVFFPDPAGSDSYPIVTYTWLLLYKQYGPDKLAAIKDFVQWGLTDGQQYLEPLGYIRLSPQAESLATSALKEIK